MGSRHWLQRDREVGGTDAEGENRAFAGGWRGSSSSVAQDKLSCSSELHNHMLLR